MHKAVAVAVVAFAAGAVAQTPLAEQRFNYTNLPYQADPNNGDRGRQLGYNRCNSTTEGQSSMCQTAYINTIDDFCLWAPPLPNSIVGDVEGGMVAWCTKAGRGTRVIPPGALQSVQFIKTPHYLQVTGYINQAMVNIEANDQGGEMDPHGADRRGNPLGGLLFSQSFNGNSTSSASTPGGASFRQVIQWHNFMGANYFCLKACDPSWDGGARMCEHVYDRAGCDVNAPVTRMNGTFLSCLGDDQLPPGVYIGSNGGRSTWYQPGEGTDLGNLPYSVFTPATSSCSTFQSAALFGGSVTASASAAANTSVSASSSAANASVSASVTGTGTATSGTVMITSRPTSAATAASAASAAATTRPASPAHRHAAPIAALFGLGGLAVFVI
ncbi:BQ2448_2748 [Microbotryum intermedium]|uniref:BQ2448_2748 protein n=1 Tax=Microbotryum intermedium TaxID=269621 RepID=A0A238FBD5_9BASI|nr:BQ2448_2748 [Microbotryum intermedium]